MSPLVSWNQLSIVFDDQLVVAPFSGQISAGEKWAVLGPNGSGKSSWMKSMLGLLPLPKDASINWAQPRSQVSYTPQNLDFDSKIPLQVDEFLEISYCKKWIQWPFPWLSQTSQNENIINAFELQPILKKPLEKLSRGQIQKVLLARTYLQPTDFVWLDEPLTGLDQASRKRNLECIFRMSKTLVMITHDPDWPSLGFTHTLQFPDKYQEGPDARPVAKSLS